MTKNDRLIEAATELNEVLGLDPPINLELPSKELCALILEAADLLIAEDVISDKLEVTIERLQKKDKKAAPEKVKKAAPACSDKMTRPVALVVALRGMKDRAFKAKEIQQVSRDLYETSNGVKDANDAPMRNQWNAARPLLLELGIIREIEKGSYLAERIDHDE